MLEVFRVISVCTNWVTRFKDFGLSQYILGKIVYLLMICWHIQILYIRLHPSVIYQAGVKVTTFVTILLTTAHVTIRHASIYWHAVIIFAASDGLFSDIHIYQFELCAYVTLFKERGSLTRLNCISYFGNFLKFLNTHFTSLSSNR